MRSLASMLVLPVAVAAALLLVPATAAAQVTPPVPLPGSPPPRSPDSALFAGIEGEARYRAHVGRDGVVTAVEVLSVPAPGHGFEDVVRRTVADWRFVPAKAAGENVEGVFEGVATFTPTLDGEYVFDVSPDAAWTALQGLLKSLKTSASRVDRERHVLVTSMGRYRSELYPSAERLGLPPGVKLQDIEWHVSVPPGFTRARVALASVVQLRRSDGMVFTRYHDAVLAEWLASRLAETLGHPAVPLSLGPTRRSVQSPVDPAIWPGGATCQKAPPPTDELRGNAPGWRAPRPLSQVRPLYPTRSRRAGASGAVRLKARITEHGTMSEIVVDPASSTMPEELKSAAVTAASLWRFSPATLEGCPVSMLATFEMSFRLR